MSWSRNPRPSEEEKTRRKPPSTVKVAAIGMVLAVVILIVAIGFSAFGFVMDKVESYEVGMITRGGKPVELVGPGIYTRFGLGSFYDMDIIDTSALENICATDPEVLTTARDDEDPIRIGVTACADVIRPGLEIGFDDYVKLYTRYKNIYLNNDAIAGFTDKDGIVHAGLFQSKAQQAMKSCIGEGTFFEAAVGQARDATARCHDDELSELLSQYGLIVENVTVPNISIPEEVGNALDAVAKAKFDAATAREQAELAKAQADQQQAEKEGQIRVAQAERQERLRQDIITAELEEKSELAQLDVIEAQKANERRRQELDKLTADEALKVAEVQAQIANANEAYLVALYAENPGYMRYLVDLALAGSFGEMDKAFLEVGTTPRMLIEPDGTANVVVDVEPSGE